MQFIVIATNANQLLCEPQPRHYLIEATSKEDALRQALAEEYGWCDDFDDLTDEELWTDWESFGNWNSHFTLSISVVKDNGECEVLL